MAGPYLKNGLGEPEIICFLHDLRCTGDNVKKKSGFEKREGLQIRDNRKTDALNHLKIPLVVKK